MSCYSFKGSFRSLQCLKLHSNLPICHHLQQRVKKQQISVWTNFSSHFLRPKLHIIFIAKCSFYNMATFVFKQHYSFSNELGEKSANKEYGKLKLRCDICYLFQCTPFAPSKHCFVWWAYIVIQPMTHGGVFGEPVCLFFNFISGTDIIPSTKGFH